MKLTFRNECASSYTIIYSYYNSPILLPFLEKFVVYHILAQMQCEPIEETTEASVYKNVDTRWQ